ncbi:hypothetical protein L2D08_11745 [Domibacillus sp. PGB-M46]|uniref:hypothetical protein n=1 Tax=Domibacillus sp. PGB-M46 TaxID=2910255 RepID=UPI001F5A1492|nr:hypothetical protein [Domibacillus sp. PGB-M46]MCI2255038.1 hypothetical protein [Domibacillus sp. PGB-M46]
MGNKRDEKEKQDETLIAAENENTNKELEISEDNTEEKELAAEQGNDKKEDEELEEEEEEEEDEDEDDNDEEDEEDEELEEEEEEEDEDEDDNDEEDEEDDEDDDEFFEELTSLIGQSVLIVTEASQLNLLGQTFRPIFCGPIVEVERSHLTIDPVTIKILNAPFFQFPLPLSIPLEKIAQLTPCFDCSERFPLI